MKLRELISLLFFFFFTTNLLAQQNADSLIYAVQTSPDDTSKVNLYNEICTQVRASDPDKALLYFNEGLKLAERLNFKKGIADLYHNAGVIQYLISDYKNASEFYEKALDIRKEMKDIKGMASTQNNMAVIFRIQGNYEKALEYYMMSYKNEETFGITKGMASALTNIGIVYYSLKNYDKCIEHYKKALVIAEKLDEKKNIALTLNNLGLAYDDKGDVELAIETYIRAQKLLEEIDNKKGLASTTNNIGLLYERKGKLEKALEYYVKALQMNIATNDLEYISNSYHNIGSCYKNMGQFEKSFENYKKGLEIAQENGILNNVSLCYSGLSELYKAMGNYREAYDYYLKFADTKDSIFNTENSQRIIEMQTKYETETKEKEIVLLQKDKALQEADLANQKLLSYLIFGGLILALVFFAVLFNRFRVIKAQKNIIEEQKLIMEEKNKDITDSINYAKRIQEAMLPFDNRIRQSLKDYFILFKPKDIVSGDFYWFMEKNGKIIIAAVDCTGHGVPGAFMSMIGNDLLNNIVGNLGITDTDEILNELHKGIRYALKQDETDSRDGMDISVVQFSLTHNDSEDREIILQYSGANNPLWIVKKNENSLQEIKATKAAIGGHTPYDQQFAKNEIILHKGDMVYLFTDGYADQFGGPNGKKFKYTRVKDKLLEYSRLDPPHQKEKLDKEFESWRGELEQIDDICIIGVRV